MARRCAVLAEEILAWPGVTARPMFGYRAFYRDSVIFAMFPDKRAFENPAAVWYKINDLGRNGESHKWRAVELNDDRSIAGAIQTLGKAHASAAHARTRKSIRP